MLYSNGVDHYKLESERTELQRGGKTKQHRNCNELQLTFNNVEFGGEAKIRNLGTWVERRFQKVSEALRSRTSKPSRTVRRRLGALLGIWWRMRDDFLVMLVVYCVGAMSLSIYILLNSMVREVSGNLTSLMHQYKTWVIVFCSGYKAILRLRIVFILCGAGRLLRRELMRS